MLEAIYHPNYIPDPIWYKSQLLLWDNIYRIIPYSVEDKFGPMQISERWNIPEEFVPTVDLQMPDFQFFEDRKRAIKKQLNEFSKENLKEYGSEDHFYLNTAKIPSWVGDSLKKYRLRKKKTLKVWGSKHYLVRDDASDFLMSCVAHGLSSNRGMSSLTNQKISCFATYANQIGKEGKEKPSGDNLKSLIAGVFDFMVPGDINKLTFKDVIEIRSEYSSLRESASNCIQSISEEFKLNEVIIKKRADDLIQSSLNKFEKEVEKFKKGVWRRIFKDWRVQTLATTMGMVSGFIAGGPAAALGIGTGAGGISILNHIAGKEEPADIGNTIQYFNKINEKIELNEFVEGLINYRKLVFGK